MLLLSHGMINLTSHTDIWKGIRVQKIREKDAIVNSVTLFYSRKTNPNRNIGVGFRFICNILKQMRKQNQNMSLYKKQTRNV